MTSSPVDLSTPERWRWRDVFYLAIAILTALGFRLIDFNRPPTFDELWDLRTSTGAYSPAPMYVANQLYLDPPRPVALDAAPPWWHVWTNMDGVQHPPLYPLTLRWWRDVFGGGNGVVRTYSIAWSIVSLTLLYATARLAISRAMALLLALVFAIAPTQIYFGQLSRSYAMVGGLGALAAWLMTRIEVLGPTRRRAIALAALTFPILLTHYFSAGIAIAMAIYGGWRLAGHRRAFFITLLSVALVYALAWGPFAMQQIDDIAESDRQWQLPHPDIVQTAALLATTPYRLLVDRPYKVERLSIAFGVVFILPWLLWKRLPALRGWALTLTCGVGLLAVMDLARSTQTLVVTRYLAANSNVAMLLLVGCAWSVREWLGYAVACTLLLMSVIYWQAGTRIEIDVPSFVPYGQQIARRSQPGEPIITFGGERGPRWGEFVLLACTQVPELGKRPIINLTAPMTSDIRARLGPRATLLTTSQTDSPQDIVPGSIIISQTMIDFDAYLYDLSLDGVAATTTPSTARTSQATTQASGEER